MLIKISTGPAVHFVAGTPASDGGAFIRYNEGIKDHIWRDYYRPLVGKNTWQLIPMLLRPLSRGTIRLASTDPYANQSLIQSISQTSKISMS